MGLVKPWCRVVVLGADDVVQATWTVEGPGSPDLLVAETLATLQLLALRQGGGVILCDLAPALKDLLGFLGLLGEVGWESEHGKEAFGIQEGVHHDDAAV
jgi:hypothetical protein